MTSASQIEDTLRQRYRQPAGVEQFGIEPVPTDRRTVGWFDLFSIMFNFLINPGTLLTGGLAVAAGLPFVAAVAAQVIGTAVALVAYVVMATIGVDYGIPGQVATRAVYGLRGARVIPSLLRRGGFGIGGEYAAINSAIDELIPARLRGRIDLIVNGSFWLGAAAGSGAAVVLLDPNLLGADTGWRLSFAIGGVLGFGIHRASPERVEQ